MRIASYILLNRPLIRKPGNLPENKIKGALATPRVPIESIGEQLLLISKDYAIR
jgi:hypothetical protein